MLRRPLKIRLSVDFLQLDKPIWDPTARSSFRHWRQCTDSSEDSTRVYATVNCHFLDSLGGSVRHCADQPSWKRAHHSCFDAASRSGVPRDGQTVMSRPWQRRTGWAACARV